MSLKYFAAHLKLTHYKSTTLQFKKIIKERRKRNDYINTTHVSNIENLKIIANQNALQK